MRLFLLFLFLLPLSALAEPVLRVVDGDTIVVRIDGEPVKVRLIGVDTPETDDPRRPMECFGREARAFTRKLLEGQSVTLEYDQERTDHYGRTLAYVYRAKDRLFVNREIIREGYGRALTRYPFAKMEAFRAYEKEARAFRHGMWANGKPPAATGQTGCNGGEPEDAFGKDELHTIVRARE